MAVGLIIRVSDNCHMAKKGRNSGEIEQHASPAMIAIGRAIAHWRNAAELSQDQLADLVELSTSQISRFESARRRPYADELIKIAYFLNIPAAKLFGLSEDITVRVTGLIGAGAVVETVEDPESWGAPEQIELGVDQEIAALLVRGESQYPRFLDGEFILYDTAPRTPAELLDQYAIVQTLDGRRLIKIIRMASSPGKWDLISHNAAPETVELLAAWRYLGTFWGPSVKMPEIQASRRRPRRQF